MLLRVMLLCSVGRGIDPSPSDVDEEAARSRSNPRMRELVAGRGVGRCRDGEKRREGGVARARGSLEVVEEEAEEGVTR